MDDLRKAWAAYQAADKEWQHANIRAFGSAEAYARTKEMFGIRSQARATLLRAVGKLLSEEPPANLREVFKRYGIDPKIRPPGGGMPLWLCLANMWRADMHAFLELEGVMKADLEELKAEQRRGPRGEICEPGCPECQTEDHGGHDEP